MHEPHIVSLRFHLPISSTKAKSISIICHEKKKKRGFSYFLKEWSNVIDTILSLL